jgi:hypothetical protein
MSGFTYPQEMWDKRFSTPEYLFGQEPSAFLVSPAHRFPSGKALALADGEGRNSVLLARQGLTVDAFAGYEVQVCETYEATIHEGTGHDGMSALLGFVAIKP